MVSVNLAAASKGGLQAFAQALAKGAAKEPPDGPAGPEPPPPVYVDRETGEIFDTAPAPPKAAPVAAPAAPPSPDASPEAEMQRIVDGALKRIAAAARSPVMQGDAYREIFIALAAVVETMPPFVAIIYAARHIMPEAERTAFLAQILEMVRAGTGTTIKRESGRWFHAFDRRTNLMYAALLACSFAVGCLLTGITLLRFIPVR